jgi:hypothetical protein
MGPFKILGMVGMRNRRISWMSSLQSYESTLFFHVSLLETYQENTIEMGAGFEDEVKEILDSKVVRVKLMYIRARLAGIRARGSDLGAGGGVWATRLMP